MRAYAILIAAMTVGLTGGYAWSNLSGPPAAPPAKPPEGTIVPIPPSPEETPAVEDSEWTSRGDEQLAPVPTPAARAKVESSVYYRGCNEVRAQGRAPLYAGEPGYRVEMDGDGDGVACEPIR